MRGKVIVVLVGGALALASCGGDDEDSISTAPATAYPPQQETAFLQSCEHQAQVASNTARDFTSVCQCSLDYLEAHQSFSEFKVDVVRYEQTGRTSPVFNDAIEACKGDIPSP